MKYQYWVRIVLINLVILLSMLFFFELYLRTFTPVSLKGYDTIKQWEKKAKTKSLSYMVRSDDPILVYENRLQHTRYNGIHVGDFGILGKVRVALKKGVRTIRILIIGDSIGSTIDRTDGHGQAGIESIYCTLLEKMLNQGSTAKGIKYEILNMSVNGYTSLQEARLLQLKGMQLAPDIIIWQYCLNDPIPDAQTLRYFFADCPRLYTTEFFVTLFEKSIHSRLVGKKFYPSLPCYASPSGGNRELHDYWTWVYGPKNNLWRTNVMQGYQTVSACVKGKNIPVVQVIFPFGTIDNAYMQGIYRQVADLATQHGFFSLNLLSAFSRYPPEKTFFSFDQFHPSEFGHVVAAETIEQYLRSTVLPTL